VKFVSTGCSFRQFFFNLLVVVPVYINSRESIGVDFTLQSTR
jgi:hypothetical protein